MKNEEIPSLEVIRANKKLLTEIELGLALRRDRYKTLSSNSEKGFTPGPCSNDFLLRFAPSLVGKSGRTLSADLISKYNEYEALYLTHAKALAAAKEEGDQESVDSIEEALSWGLSEIQTLEDKNKSFINSITRSVSGQKVLYPSEALLFISVLNPALQSRLNANFWGEDWKSSESETALNQYTKGFANYSSIRFLPEFSPRKCLRG